MATKAQIEANRRNAQKSTGPTTAAGKAKCAMNRYDHGFSARTIILDWEHRDEFEALRKDLWDEYQPVTRTEMILVDRMVQNHWNAERAISMQGITIGGLFRTDDPRPRNVVPDLGLLIRYQQNAERAFDKVRKDLVTIQEQRKKSEIGSDSQKPVEAAPAPEPEPAYPTPEPLTTYANRQTLEPEGHILERAA